MVSGKNVEEYFADLEGLNTKFSSRVEYNYLNEENIEKLIGTEVDFVPDFAIDEGTKQMILGRLKDYWETLTPETRDSIQKIEFSDILISLAREDFAAYTLPGQITFGERSDRFTWGIFEHEAAHANQFRLEQNKEISFEKEWKNVAGESNKFDETIYTYKDFINYKKYADFSKAGYGYTSPYGTTNVHEDVATFTATIAADTKNFKGLLSEDHKWSDTYRGKLDLLYKYKFITKEQYQNALKIGMSQ